MFTMFQITLIIHINRHTIIVIFNAWFTHSSDQVFLHPCVRAYGIRTQRKVNRRSPTNFIQSGVWDRHRVLLRTSLVYNRIGSVIGLYNDVSCNCIYNQQFCFVNTTILTVVVVLLCCVYVFVMIYCAI